MDEAGAACGHRATEFLRATPFRLKKTEQTEAKGCRKFL